MFELLCMSLLSIAYVDAFIQEAKEEKLLKEKERIANLKIKVFCYAIRHHLEYNDVVESLQKKTLSFDDLEK